MEILQSVALAALGLFCWHSDRRSRREADQAWQLFSMLGLKVTRIDEKVRELQHAAEREDPADGDVSEPCV